MFRAPAKSDLTVKFETENFERKKSLSAKRIEALRMIGKKDYGLMQEFNLMASQYNEDLSSAGGQSGFGFSMLHEKTII